MREKNKKNIFLGIFIGLFLFILIVGGILATSQVYALTVDSNIGTTLSLGTADLESTVINIIQWALGFLGLVAVIMMMYGGFVWMTAAGNEDKVARAKKIITRAGIGLVIVLLSWAIVSFIVKTMDKVTGGGGTGGGSTGFFTPDIFTWSETQSSFAMPGDYATNVNRCSRLQPVFNHRIDGATFGSAFSTDNTGEIFIQEENLPSGSGVWQDFDPLPGQVEIVTSRNSITIKHDDKLFGSLVQNQNYRLWIPKSVTNTSGDPLGACNIAVGNCVEGNNPHTGGTNDAYVWDFQVGTQVDDVDPYITNTYPASNGLPDRNVSRAPTFNVNFNEAIDATTIDAGGYPYVTNFVLEQLDGSGGTVVATVDNTADLGVAITAQGFSVSLINGAVLDSFTWYRITVSGIQDLCGNDMVIYPAWEFETNDLTPGIGGQYPTGTDECPLASPVISTTFNTTMYYNNVRIRLSTGGVTVSEADITASAIVSPNPYTMSGTNGQIQIEDPGPLSNIDNNFRAFNLYPTTPLVPGTTYLVEIFTDKVMDINGTLLEGNWSFSVVTENQCRCTPFISSIVPNSGLQEQCVTINGQCFQGTDTHPATAQLTFTDYPDGNPSLIAPTPGIGDNYISTTIPAGFNLTDFRARPQVEITYNDVNYGTASSANNSVDYSVNSPDVSNGACIWGVTPNSGYVGTGINISGIRFDPTSGLKDVVYNNPITDTQNILSWSDTNALTTIPITLPPMVNYIRIHNDAGFSNPYPFTVNPIPPDHPVVINKDPVCDSACINAMIQADVSYNVTGSINNTTVKIYSCADSSCSFVAGLVPVANTPTSIFTTNTNININPDANLIQNTYYRVVLTEGIEINATPGSNLVGLNFDDNNDGTNDAYSWTFKTKNDPNICQIDSVTINPTPQTSPINTNINYNSTAKGSPDSCNSSGQVLNPSGFTWTWSVSDSLSTPRSPLPASVFSSTLNNSTIHTDISTGTDPVNVDVEANDGINSENISGVLNIIDCETDAHCQSNCPVAGNNSVCDLTKNKCTPWVGKLNVAEPSPMTQGWGLSPTNGPAGTTVSINGCYFGNTPGTVNIGTQPTVLNCANPWFDNLIITTTNELLGDGLNRVNVITSDSLSNEVDSGQEVNFDVVAFCNGVSTPATGLPSLCSINPISGREGDNPITFNGFNLTNNSQPQTLARFSDGGGGFIDSTTGQGNDITYDNATVPINTMTGPAKIAVQSGVGYCESNEINFGISCNTATDCSTSCCDLVSNTCQPAGFCSTGGPGSICQLPANAPECQSGPLVTDNNYRCIDNNGNLDPTGVNDYDSPPKSILTQGVAADVSCLTCCDPDVDNDGVLNEPNDQQVSAEGLTCVADQGSCSGNERGLYCGCDYTNLTVGDAQCGDQACGNDTNNCCYDRPSILSTNPLSGFVSECTNFSIEYIFDTPSNSGIDNNTLYMKDTEATSSIWVTDGVSPIIGSINPTTNGFIFTPDSLFDAGITITINIREDIIKDNFGIAISDIPNNIDTRNWSTGAGAQICQIDHLNFQVWDSTLSTPKSPPSLFTCATDGCIGDQLSTDFFPSLVDGNQQIWFVDAIGSDGLTLFSPSPNEIKFTWSENDPQNIFTVTSSGIVPYSYICPPESNNDFSCLITSDNNNGRGELIVTADGQNTSIGNLGMVTGSAQINAMLCEKPWPNPYAPNFDDLPFEDSMALPKPDTITMANNFTTNFSTWYCRDNGLPALDTTVVHEETIPSVVGKDELLKEYFFLRPDSDDGIGIRVYENENGKSAREWYFNQFGSAAPDPQDLQVDGYNAIRAGRTVYVAAWNIIGTGADGSAQVNDILYPQIYLISYNEGASEDTIAIYNALINNWQFNINDTESNQSMMHRDMQRVNDLNDIYTSALEYKGLNGSFPKLEGGTYIKNLTSSGWPSWQDEFGGNLGINVPIDPFNTFNGCISPYNENTCWDDTNQEYDCPSGSHTYQYIVAADGETADIYANLEYLRLNVGNWRIGVATEIDPCSANFNNATCSCFNYTRNATGTITDRLGPTFNVITIGGNLAPFNNVQGTSEIFLSDIADVPSGVGRVEFYIDGQYKYTDTDSASWSWDFISNEYTDGNHILLIRAYDTVGNWTEHNYTININNSGVINNVPFVDILSPADGETISGIVSLAGVASDDGNIISFRFDAYDQDGNSDFCAFNAWPTLSTSLFNTPSGVTWDTTIDCTADGIPDTPNGIYTLVATATDDTGNVSTKTITVKVENFDTTGPTVVIGNIPGLCSVGVCSDGISCNHYDICSDDLVCPAGDVCDQSTPCTITPPLPSDSNICQRQGIFPDLSGTNPSINIAVDDLNDISVVQIYIDDIYRGNATYDTGNNWIWEWNTFEYSNKEHTFAVFAYDSSSNVGSDKIVIPVDNELNDDIAPTISFNIPPTPADGTPVVGDIDIEVDAQDNRGVSYVNFYIDYRRQFIDTNSVDGWLFTINTDILTDGWHSIQVEAVDSAGNRSESKEIFVNVRGNGGPKIDITSVYPLTGNLGDNFCIQATVTDDDGIASVIAYIQSPDGNDIGDPVYMSDINNDDIYNGSWTSTIGIDTAFYVDIEAKDSLNNISRYDNITGQVGTCGATSSAAPVITSATSAIGMVDDSTFSYNIVATNSPTSYTISSGLPPGLSLIGSTVSGTPTASGYFTVTMTAINASGSDTKPLNITINPSSSSSSCSCIYIGDSCNASNSSSCNALSGCIWDYGPPASCNEQPECAVYSKNKCDTATYCSCVSF